MGVYRLQVWHDNRWAWGRNDYSLEAAQLRVLELRAKGIRARIKPAAELFGA